MDGTHQIGFGNHFQGLINITLVWQAQPFKFVIPPCGSFSHKNFEADSPFCYHVINFRLVKQTGCSIQPKIHISIFTSKGFPHSKNVTCCTTGLGNWHFKNGRHTTCLLLREFRLQSPRVQGMQGHGNENEYQSPPGKTNFPDASIIFLGIYYTALVQKWQQFYAQE